MPAHRRRRLRLKRTVLAAAVTGAALIAGAGPALACAGLVTAGGNIKLVRTATLAAWHDGYEHYVTAFTFEGGGAEVGSLVPLPAVPDKVERGGDWTLQRLERETQPRTTARRGSFDEAAPGATSGDAEVVYETRIDALDITILKGGSRAVADWAEEHGYALSPDAPETLEYYARQSPVFMAARFDAAAARQRGQQVGEGTPIHLTIPLDNPWVPLRILALGRQASESIQADVYLLTPHRPHLDPAPGDGLALAYDDRASDQLLDDLRSDKGMEWMPERAWLTYLRVGEEAGDLRYDLDVDVRPSGSLWRVASDAAAFGILGAAALLVVRRRYHIGG
ncbi:MAG: DUF2330 domain-containing protein [Acidimicrobiia bacterium]